jgi:hypothetical protein
LSIRCLDLAQINRIFHDETQGTTKVAQLSEVILRLFDKRSSFNQATLSNWEALTESLAHPFGKVPHLGRRLFPGTSWWMRNTFLVVTHMRKGIIGLRAMALVLIVKSARTLPAAVRRIMFI